MAPMWRHRQERVKAVTTTDTCSQVVTAIHTLAHSETPYINLTATKPFTDYKKQPNEAETMYQSRAPS